MNLDEIQAKWQEEPDEYLLKAVENDLAEYPVEIQEIIISEVKKRKLHDHSVQEEIRIRLARRRRKHKLKVAYAVRVVLLGIFLYMFGLVLLYAIIPLRQYSYIVISFLLAAFFCGIIWISKRDI